MRLPGVAHARSLPQQLGCALLNGCVSWVAAQTHFSEPRLSHTHMGSVLHARGSFSTRWRAQGTRNPARSGGAQPERTSLLKHTHAHAQSSAQKAMCPLPWGTCGDTACYLLISPDSQPPRTKLRLRAKTSDLSSSAKRTKNTPKDTSVLFISCWLFPPPLLSCDFFPAARAGTGTEPELRGWKATRSGTAAFSLFLDLFRCGGKKRSGSGAGCAANAEVFPLSSLIFLPSSLHRSICPLLSISPFVSMFLGPCDFAKMHHQQRMAALGTDKELSDLLDFSAVRNIFPAHC